MLPSFLKGKHGSDVPAASGLLGLEVTPRATAARKASGLRTEQLRLERQSRKMEEGTQALVWSQSSFNFWGSPTHVLIFMDESKFS